MLLHDTRGDDVTMVLDDRMIVLLHTAKVMIRLCYCTMMSLYVSLEPLEYEIV